MRTTTELRETILDAARTEFAQYGLAGARIDRIAGAAQASKERLYAHFKDKEALFRSVVAADSAEFFAAVTLRPDAVPEFAGDVYDLACRRPEHLRMITWASLEGLSLDPPPVGEWDSVPARDIAVIEAAQAAGYVDEIWHPMDLLVLLFGIGLAWAQSPHPDAVATDPAISAARRAAAVEAARRVVLPAHESGRAAGVSTPGRAARHVSMP
ncbi:TetR family transcriptional regulator [Mycobacterium sp. 852002-53434_SCH5985345]|uniref:TetR family transcriptional regulator n=1 Tax=unclassified Mycobacterium TaxID=2642494 RepID=UPI00080183C3|nr:MULTISPECIES: TetR family transcriptional regulator [unclassified Mycobacterium]OBF49032.1 TetR family transcriptional regulator [Mycobacterium sp. 852002-53434_SCH5985345]OBF77850.1 TetR family transcriptional regulator [Mycobacterium sp. 852002-51613_SCH5001154]